MSLSGLGLASQLTPASNRSWSRTSPARVTTTKGTLRLMAWFAQKVSSTVWRLAQPLPSPLRLLSGELVVEKLIPWYSDGPCH